MSQLNTIIDKFQQVDRDFILELLMDFAEKLPMVPEELRTAENAAAHRVHECLTPVALWVDVVNQKVTIRADVPRESPTVRGFVSVLIHGLDGATPGEVLDAPQDILQKTGLASLLGMNRVQGLSAIYQRIKNEVRQKQS